MRQHTNLSRPSPAIIVAVVALVAALAGTALAGPGASTSALSKKTVKKIATKQINELAPGLSVAHANSADTAADADRLDGVDASGFLASTQRAFQAADDSAENFGSNVPFLTLDGLPAGTYTVVAKLSIDNDDVASGNESCGLEVPGPNDDVQRLDLAANGAPGAEQLPVALATTFTGGEGSSISLECQNIGGDNDAEFARIIATLVT